MDKEAFESLLTLISFKQIAAAAAFLAATWIAVRVLKAVLDRLALRSARMRLRVSRLFPVLRLLIWIGAFGFVLFRVFSPPANVVLALATSAGIALGLAAQDVLRNAVAGVVMLFDRPFSVGDMVSMSGHYGEVVGIDLSVTRIRTFDDSLVTVPNAEVFKQAVLNSNAGDLTEMVVVPFDLPAAVDPRETRAMAWEAASCSPYAYLKKPISVTIEDRFDRAFLTRYNVKVYVVDLRLERLLASDVLTRIKREAVARGLLPREVEMVTAAEPAAPGA